MVLALVGCLEATRAMPADAQQEVELDAPPEGHEGGLDCAGILKCQEKCKLGDSACATACVNQGSDIARTQAFAFQGCWDKCHEKTPLPGEAVEVPWAGFEEHICLFDECSDQALQCIPAGTASCDEALGCYLGCLGRGGVGCEDQCSASLDAMEKLLRLLDCGMDSCKEDCAGTGLHCSDCLSTQCSCEWDACMGGAPCEKGGGQG